MNNIDQFESRSLNDTAAAAYPFVGARRLNWNSDHLIICEPVSGTDSVGGGGGAIIHIVSNTETHTLQPTTVANLLFVTDHTTIGTNFML